MNATAQTPAALDPRAAASARLVSLRRFFEAEPANQRLRRDVLDTAVAAGEFHYVRELAEQRLSANPADSEARFDRATAFIGLKDFTSALDALQPLDATIPGVRFNTGLCHFMLANYAAALPFFQAGYEAGERSVGALRCHVRTLHHLGEVDDALQLAKDNEPLVLSDSHLAGVAALAAVDANDTAAGARYAQAALAADPDNADALVTAGMLHSLDLDMERARAAFERVVTANAHNGRAWVGLGTLSMAARDFPAAITALERGLETQASHIGSWHALGWAHLFGGNLEKAESVFAHSLELNRNFSESHGSLAVVAAMRGDRAHATHLIEIAERLDRNCMTSKYAETLLAAPQDQREMLIRLAEKVPVQGPKFAEMMRRSNRGPR